MAKAKWRIVIDDEIVHQRSKSFEAETLAEAVEQAYADTWDAAHGWSPYGEPTARAEVREELSGKEEECDVCGKTFLEADLRTVLVTKASSGGPEENDRVCAACVPRAFQEPRDEAYERAAARYDGEGKDWR